jgi:hypothetical protein
MDDVRLKPPISMLNGVGRTDWDWELGSHCWLSAHSSSSALKGGCSTWRSQRRTEPGWDSERTLTAPFVHPKASGGHGLIS